MRWILVTLTLIAPAVTQESLAQESRPEAKPEPLLALGLRLAQDEQDAALRPGLRIAEVTAESPAAAAGLEAGDVLIRSAGVILGDEAALVDQVQPGARLELAWFRRTDDGWVGKTAQLDVPGPDAQTQVRDALGLEFAITESKIRRRIIRTATPFGFKVSRVTAGSIADQLGIERGNLLMKWDGKPIRTVDELAGWIRETAPGATVEIVVSRKKRKVSILSRHPWESVALEVTMPDGR